MTSKGLRRRLVAALQRAGAMLAGGGGTFALAATFAVGVATPGAALADRCTQNASGWSCTHKHRYNYYWCGGYYVPRAVRWQVPEGTPPAGGWPVAFYYAGTQPADYDHAFDRDFGEPYGLEYEPQIIRELLDNPNGTGRKYAVFVADPPVGAYFMQYWHTNSVYPYTASCDYQFFPDFWGEIAAGNYGAASQYNLSKRYAYGMSSGGYNTSRMAVTYNSGSNAGKWKALGIVAASYATCAGWSCSVPTLPTNHPPTKFWHGQNDSIVPMSTMYTYFNKLGSQGLVRQKLEHPYGHQFTVDVLGTSGIKAWFDNY